MIILTDYDSQFWIEEIDYDFMLKLREDMRIQSDIKCLADHLANGLRKKVSVRSLGKTAKLKVPFEIGGHDGLLFNATIVLRVHVNEQENFEQHYSLIKSFFRYYE